MKKLNIKVLDKFKAYSKDSLYSLEGDLILISGINGSGKSQLLKIIANNSNEKISRTVNQISENGESNLIENILFLSFRDNINLGNDFGQYSVTFQQSSKELAWQFYNQNIKFENIWSDQNKKEKFNNGKLIFNNDGSKNPSWRSIEHIVSLLKVNYQNDTLFKLSRDEFEQIIPNDFMWRNENDIIQQVGNLFYLSCCKRNDEQIECSKTTAIFDNNKWLNTAPWTILNKLFNELGFKYRFKDDYNFHTPNMEENPKLRINNEARTLNDLSDGEKAILKLALISLDEEISKDVKLVLFDEYDAPLNPSLTEAFYKVIEEFYIKKGIQVIITTHSPATISLAPSYTQFYEIFNQENNSPKIIKVNQFDYAELKEANKSFYDKLRNQENRISELQAILSQNGNALLVEDAYCQIYKIAYLKLKGIDNFNESNLDEVFDKNSNFSINGNYSTGGLYNYLNCDNTTLDSNCNRICLFDFDSEGYKKFEDLYKSNKKMYKTKKGTISTCIYLKHKNCKRFAMMIPVPERLNKFVSEDTSADCFIEIETLLSEEFLKNNNKTKQRSLALPFYMLKDNHKKDFWKDLITADKEVFKDFKPLFDSVESIFNN